MSDYYHQFLASMSGIGANPPDMPQQQPPPPPFQHGQDFAHSQLQLQQLQQLQQQQQQQLSQPPQLPQLPQHLQHPQLPPHPHHPQPPPPPPPPQHLHEMMPLSLPPHLHQQPAMSMGVAGAPSPTQFSGFYGTFQEPMMFNGQKSQRHRRKSAPGVEHVKHRRTRSGCFTCRSRRIKCDEGRPICERCKKGNRECLYPEPPASKGSAVSSSASGATAPTSSRSSSRELPTPSQQASPENSDEEDDDDDMEHEGRLDTILDDDEADESAGAATSPTGTGGPSRQSGDESLQQYTVTFNNKNRLLHKSRSASLLSQLRMSAASAGTASTQATIASKRVRQGSETPSFEGKSSSPATSTGTHGTTGSSPHTAQSFASSDLLNATSSPLGTSLTAADWSHLPQDVRFFLGYYADNITYLHYGMPTDPDDVMRNTLPAIAVRHEPLLYALVAFSAYHYILRDPAAKLQQFLMYYDQSVRLLLNILKRKETHSLGTLLTILQLATIEEYLGDWVNLMGHQKAALEMLTDIYTPETAVQTPIGRTILHWYCRFDVFVGIMGGFATVLPREWFTSPIEYYQARLASNPADVPTQIEECSARLRLISFEMSLLYARAKEDDNGCSGERSTLNQGTTSGGGGGLAAFPSFAPDEAFVREHARILHALHEWKDTLDAIITTDGVGGTGENSPKSQQHPLMVTDFSYAQPLNDDDIVNPYMPGVLYYPPLFNVTLICCEWQSVVVMHEMQAAQLAMAAVGAAPQATQATVMNPTAMASNPSMRSEGGPCDRPDRVPGKMTVPQTSSDVSSFAAAATSTTAGPPSPLPPEPISGLAGTAAGQGQAMTDMPAELAGLAKRAYIICQIFETLERWPASPPGCLIFTQAMLAIAALFLPRDSLHHMWIRRKFALIETMGYIFPLTTRTRMAELFNDASCAQWWLPNNEGFSPILQSVRAFADERNVTAVSAQTENLREIRHVFAKLQIGEGGGKRGSTGTSGQDPNGQRVADLEVGASSSTSRPNKSKSPKEQRGSSSKTGGKSSKGETVKTDKR